MAAETPGHSRDWLPRGTFKRVLLALVAAALLVTLFFQPHWLTGPAEPQTSEPATPAAATAPAPGTTPAAPEIVIMGRINAPPEVQLGNVRIGVATRIPQVNDWRIYPDVDGTFKITGIPVGASGGIGFVEITGYVARVVWEKNNWPTAPLPPGFTPGANYIDFRALPAGSYDGLRVDFVKRATLKGLVTDEAGKPVAGIFVEGEGVMTQTDDQGAYEQWITPAPKINLKIDGENIVEDQHLPDAITAEPGQTIERNIRVRRIVHPPHDKTITGRILAADGKPAADVEVFLSNHGILPEDIVQTIGQTAASWHIDGWRDPVVTHTRPDGRFVFDNLLAGHTDIWAHDGDHWAWSQQVESGRQGLELKLAPQSAKVHFGGTVTDEQSRPVAGAQITLLNADYELHTHILAQAQTDAAGHYALEATPAWETNLALRLLCLDTRENVPTHVAWRLLPRMSTDDLSLQFKPPVPIAGRVLDVAGKPVPNANVWVVEAHSPDWSDIALMEDDPVKFTPTATDAQGRYTFSGFPVGSMIAIRARAAEFGERSDWCTIASGAKAPDLILPPGITLAGTVRLPSGQPAAGATVTLANLFRPFATATSDHQGHFRVGGLDPSQFTEETFFVQATEGAGAAELEGRARFNMQFQPGDDVTALDVPLHPSLTARRRAWLSAPATSPASACHILLLDSADLKANPATRHDLLTCLDSAGRELWHFDAFKDTWPDGSPRLMAVHSKDHSIWICQNVGGGLLKINADGTLAWSRPAIQAGLIAFDPQTSNAWVIAAGADERAQDLLIVSPAGDILKRRILSAIDLAYSPADSCFWILGDLLRRFDHDGNITWESEQKFFNQGALAVNPTDGTVWVSNGTYPDAIGAEGHVMKLDRSGQMVKEFAMPGTVWAIDAARQHIWTAGADNELVRMTSDGVIERRIPLKPTSLSLESDTGNVWATCDQGLFRISADGAYLWSQPGDKPAQKLVVSSGP